MEPLVHGEDRQLPHRERQRGEALPFVVEARALRDEHHHADLCRSGAHHLALALHAPEMAGQRARLQKIPLISITPAGYAEKVSGLTSPRAKAPEMEHAIRHHIGERMDTDPAHCQRLSEHLEQIISQLRDQSEQLALALTDFLPVVTSGRTEDSDGPERVPGPLVSRSGPAVVAGPASSVDRPEGAVPDRAGCGTSATDGGL
ncbi:hypothetical protein ABT346_07855 [Micromonospora peucetia]|uniref:hypothetical protein n=1 Tax=Micromonospora peucetia TaxID=47871 RepID=UPI00331C716D